MITFYDRRHSEFNQKLLVFHDLELETEHSKISYDSSISILFKTYFWLQHPSGGGSTGGTYLGVLYIGRVRIAFGQSAKTIGDVT
jgi:hypothetical protein